MMRNQLTVIFPNTVKQNIKVTFRLVHVASTTLGNTTSDESLSTFHVCLTHLHRFACGYIALESFQRLAEALFKLVYIQLRRGMLTTARRGKPGVPEWGIRGWAEAFSLIPDSGSTASRILS